MSSNSYRGWRFWGGVAVVALLAIFSFLPKKNVQTRERYLHELDRRDGMLYPHGEETPFTGLLVQDYEAGVRKAAVEIQGGKAHGVSRGWFDNGQLEVQEHFTEGVSHGLRERWYRNGARRCTALIEAGKVQGEYCEWHDNGQLAVRMNVWDGSPEGEVEAWFPSGALKSRVRFEGGKQVSRAFFDDAKAGAALTAER